jgi:hypothetical protein
MADFVHFGCPSAGLARYLFIEAYSSVKMNA